MAFSSSRRRKVSSSTHFSAPKAQARTQAGWSPLSRRTKHPSHLTTFPSSGLKRGIPKGQAMAQLWQPMHRLRSITVIPVARSFCMHPTGQPVTQGASTQCRQDTDR